jgi:hypothetical protein
MVIVAWSRVELHDKHGMTGVIDFYYLFSLEQAPDPDKPEPSPSSAMISIKKW